MTEFSVGDIVHYADMEVAGMGVIHSKTDDSDNWLVSVEEKDKHRAYFIRNTARVFRPSDLALVERASPTFDYAPGDRVTVISDRTADKRYVGKAGAVEGVDTTGSFTEVSVTLDNGDLRVFRPDELEPLASFEVGDWVVDPDGEVGIIFHDDGSDYRQYTVGMTDSGESYNYGPASLQHYCPECGCTFDAGPVTIANDNDEIEDAVQDITDGLAVLLAHARAA